MILHNRLNFFQKFESLGNFTFSILDLYSKVKKTLKKKIIKYSHRSIIIIQLQLSCNDITNLLKGLYNVKLGAFVLLEKVFIEKKHYFKINTCFATLRIKKRIISTVIFSFSGYFNKMIHLMVRFLCRDNDPIQTVQICKTSHVHAACSFTMVDARTSVACTGFNPVAKFFKKYVSIVIKI